MKKILTVLLCSIFVLSVGLFFVSCNGIKEYIAGDFTYKIFANESDAHIEITGLSDNGKKKEVIVVPEEIDGLPVVAIRDRSIFGSSGVAASKLASTELKKIYFVNTRILVDEHDFVECDNLKQIFILNVSKDDEIGQFVFSVIQSNVYIFKDIYDIAFPHWMVKERKFPANVTYHYNYFGSPNGDCFCLDQLEIGEIIGFLPPKPTRPSVNKDYQFEGWYTEKECVNKWDFTTDIMYESGDLDLYAKWI